MKTFWKILWVGSLVYLLVLFGLSYSQLPDRMASHFNAQGVADGWSSKQTFYLILIPLMIFFNLLPFLSRWLINKAPQWANIPNKKYWLSSAANKKIMMSMMDDMMIMITAMLNVMFIVMFQYTYDVNIHGSARFSFYWMFLPVGLIIVIPILYIIKLSRPKSS